MLLRLTLDTNAVIYAFDSEHESPVELEEIESLFKHAFGGRVNLAITTAAVRDIGRDSDEGRRQQLLLAAAKFPVVGAPFRVGMSRVGSDDIIIDESDRQVIDRIQQIVFPAGIDPNSARGPNKLNDVDHLFAHLRDGRDILVTVDTAMVSRAGVLDAELGIRVMRPREALEVVERTVNVALIAEDFRADFSRLCQIIVEHVQNGGTEDQALQDEYTKLRERMLRSWPKLVRPLAQSRVDGISTPMPGGGQVMASRFSLYDLQSDPDPFAPFYARERLVDAVAELPEKLRLAGQPDPFGDLQREQERCRTLLTQIVGALESTGAW